MTSATNGGDSQIIDRQRGCFLGLAIGDALGAAVEFQYPGTFEPVTDFRAGGPHGLDPGEWTDDTSMALALADSIVHEGWNLDDQAQRYVHWYQHAKYSSTGTVFDVGNTVSQALFNFRATHDARTSGPTAISSSGNGSIMRMAPVPIAYYSLLENDLPQLIQLAGESSIPTHASPLCIAACQYMTLIVAGFILGIEHDQVLSPDWPPVKTLRKGLTWNEEMEAIATGSFQRLHPPDIKGSGFVIKSLEAALWAFYQADDPAEAILAAVNLGDDADTTGAVCGQLAGAYWGASALPPHWRDELAKTDLIESILQPLIEFSTQP